MQGILYMNVSILENQAAFDKGMSMISEERKKKIEALKNPAAARLSLGAGILLQIALEKGGYGGQKEKIKEGEHGKLYLPDTDFHFSLSHSGEYAVCAYGNHPIGVDLQKVKDHMPKHLKKILTEKETSFLDGLDEQEKREVFYRIWAKKESIIKWDGRGLRIPLEKFSVVEEDFAERILFEGKRVHLQEFDFLLSDYTVSVCSEYSWMAESITEVSFDFLTKY